MPRPLFPDVNQSAISLVLMSVSAALSAQPNVDGNTISWPDDGWYQVQDAMTYASLCQGGRSCEVPDGRYIVINHDSGLRYEDVTVPAQVSEDGIVVSSNTISWPDDGWYQVQDSLTYASLCQGGRNCEVPDGRYIVINHDSGRRYEGITVPALQVGNEGVVIDGNTISWPDDGWYQVQDAVNYASLCQGGRSCEVPDGRYIVINHTTGARFENLVVEGGSVIEQPTDPQISAANALPLFQQITAVINGKAIRSFLDTTAEEVSAPIEASALFPMPQPLDEFALSSGPSDGQETDYVIQATDWGQAIRLFDYACIAGGDMRWYLGSSSFHEMVFDNCVVGDATYDGIASRRMNTMRGEYTSTYYTGYARTGSDGQRSELSGRGLMEYLIPFSQLDPLDYQASWNDFQFSVMDNGTPSLQISGYTLTRDFEKEFGSLEYPYCSPAEVDGTTLSLREYTARDQISGQFDVSADWSDGNLLSVELDLTSLDSVRVGCGHGSTDDFSSYDPYEPGAGAWEGQIQVMAADGSSMVIRPVSDSEAESHSFVIDLDNGEQLGPVDWSGAYVVEVRPWEVGSEVQTAENVR